MTDQFALNDRPSEHSNTLTIAQTHTKASETQSPTALTLDKWGQRIGQQLLDEHQTFQKHNLTAHETADMFGAAFEQEPTLTEHCSDQRRHDFFKTLLETPEYHGLHAQTALDEVSSEIAALAFAEQWANIKKTQEHKDPNTNEINNLKHIAKALNNAEKEVGDYKNAARAFGHNPGTATKSQTKELTELYKKVRNDPALHRICSLAGKYRLAAQAKQRRKALHGRDDIVGVEMDNDVGRLLPQELLKLSLPETQLDTLRRFAERQTMCREWRGVEPVARGPIIVCVDESGSTSGETHCLEKAIALTMLWVAKHQKRWCGLIGFSSGGEVTKLAVNPKHTDNNALADWLTHFFGGGTHVPLDTMEQLYTELGAPPGRTDVILITDGVCNIQDETKQKFNAWKKKAKCKMVTLAINCDRDSASAALGSVSDEVHSVSRNFGTEESGVDHILSI